MSVIADLASVVAQAIPYEYLWGMSEAWCTDKDQGFHPQATGRWFAWGTWLLV